MDRWDFKQCSDDDDDDDDESVTITNVYTFGGAATQSTPSFASAPFCSPNVEPPSAPFEVGCRVRVTGLVSAGQHNGQTGTVSIALDKDTGRLGVALDNGGQLKIKECNLDALSPAASSCSGAAVAHEASSSDDPDPFALWVTAARAQSMPLTGCPSYNLPPSLRVVTNFLVFSTTHPQSQLFSTRSYHLTQNAYSIFDPILLPLLMPSRVCRSHLHARITFATIFRIGPTPQTPPLLSQMKHQRPP
jgi:hypothetical protein